MEPAILGLIVAPSPAGFLLAAMALLSFVAHTPLKIALVDRLRSRRLERTRLAERVAAAELALVGILLLIALVVAGHSFWVPLVIAVPLIGLGLWYDARSRSRRLLPELAGTIGMGSIAAAVALAGGGDSRIAAGLWAIAAARAIAVVVFVRVQLRRAKDQPHRLSSSDTAQIVAVAVVAAGYALDAVSPGGVLAIAGLAIAHSWLVRRKPPAAPVLGAQQVVLGLSVVLIAGLGALAP